jgi:KipI family sensor histidine kinase inhibitor
VSLLEAPARIVDLGDAALLVVFGTAIDAGLNERAHRLARHLRASHRDDPRWGRPVPAYASVLVPYDPLRLTAAEARTEVGSRVAEAERAVAGPLPDTEPSAIPRSGAVVEVPVRYGGVDGPDLAEVADRLGLPEAEVVRLHTGSTYRVFMLGFTPGFPYLGPLPDALVLPRRPTPRTRVPAGSVAIAGAQTGIYPSSTPGGWHVIGRTDLRLWDPTRRPPALLEPGGHVRFVAER